MDTLLELPRTEEKPQGEVMLPGPLNMAMRAMKVGMSIADLRDMLTLQKEWEANEARKAYALAMSGFKAEPMKIIKSKAVGYETKATPEKKSVFVGYKHAELSDVTDAICPAMSKHQLSHRWDVQQDPNFITVTCRITHALGYSESIQMTGAPDNTGNKNRLQQIASTVTYLQRYTLLAITGMSTKGEDDDGQGGEGNQVEGRASADDEIALGKTEEKKAAIDYYPQDKFDKNLSEWTALITSGEKTADRVIGFVERKQAMTDAQKTQLRAIKTQPRAIAETATA